MNRPEKRPRSGGFMSDWIDAESHADRAFEMYERGRWAEAEAELRKAIELNPDHAEWHFNLALTQEAAGRDAEAVATYQRAIALMPMEIEPLLAGAAVANRLQRHEQAIEWLSEAINLDPNAESAYAQMMDALLGLGRHDDVETTHYLAQHALEEQSAACLAIMADSLMERGELGKASWCLREAMRTDPSMPRLRARLGAVFAAMGSPARAQQMFLRDLRDDPGNIDTLLEYGELLLDLGRLPDAAEKFRRILEFEPANVDAHARLGHIALRSQQVEQAAVEFDLVYKLDPEFPQIRLNLATARLEMGKHEEARRCLREELERLRMARAERQTFPTDMQRFGDLLLQAGMYEAAGVIIEQGIDREGESPEMLRTLALARYALNDRDAGTAASRRALRLDPKCVRSMHNLALAALHDNRLRTAAGWIHRGLAVDRHDEGLRRLRARLILRASGRFAIGTLARLVSTFRRGGGRAVEEPASRRPRVG